MTSFLLSVDIIIQLHFSQEFFAEDLVSKIESILNNMESTSASYLQKV